MTKKKGDCDLGNQTMNDSDSHTLTKTPHPNHIKIVKRKCDYFRKQADKRCPTDRHHLYELIAEVEWLLTDLAMDTMLTLDIFPPTGEK